MKKLSANDINNGLALLHIALQNWNMCKSTWSIRSKAKVNVVALKEDIICLSHVMPTSTTHSDFIFKLLSEANDLAVQASIGDEYKLTHIKNLLLKLKAVLDKLNS